MRYVDVPGTRMAYREAGRGDPVVFLHGNPTSSYLWRDVLGHGPNAPDPALFGPLRTAAGEDLVLRDNVFVEAVLPAGALRTLTDEEMDAYRQPYRRPGEDRRPTLTWPREIPVDGTPADVHRIVAANAGFMALTPIPKLFLDGDPGALLTGPLRDLCRTWPHQQEVTVPGLHFLPEDSPHLIGAAIAGWLPSLP